VQGGEKTPKRLASIFGGKLVTGKIKGYEGRERSSSDSENELTRRSGARRVKRKTRCHASLKAHPWRYPHLGTLRRGLGTFL